MEERNFVERYRFEVQVHGVQQAEKTATSTRAHVQQFAVALTTETTLSDMSCVRTPSWNRPQPEFHRADESYVFELPLSDVTVVDGEKAVLVCRVTVTPAAEVTWYVENVEIRQTGDCGIVFTADGWGRPVRTVNEAGTCTGTAHLTVLPATARERTAKELIKQESTGVTVTIRIRPDEGRRQVEGRSRG